ncbi:MAG: DNA-directed RNA polymerase subunit H [Nitrososphaerales archaeon]
MEKDSEEELHIDITKHIFVPKHVILTPEEAKEVLKKYNAKPEQFPYILSTDPVIKEIGAKPGDLIKIIRRSETAGEAIYYRYVVEG